VREEGTGSMQSGARRASGKTQRWLSADVPGHEVRVVAEFELEGRKLIQTRDVVEFHVPPKSAAD